jgi:predicted HTH transcriptional regulator
MKKQESHRIEYKSELTKHLDIEKEVIAFLNSKEGGVIYFGINNNGDTLGINDADGDMLKIKDRIKNNILPSAMGLFDVILEEIESKPIIKINIAVGSEKPYFRTKYGMSQKGCFCRVGSASEPMNQKMIDELFSKRIRNSIGKIRSPRQSLSFEQLKIYYQEKRKQLNDNFKTNLELLNADNDLNYIAYLLADENSVSFKIAKYKSNTRVDLIENNEYGYNSIIKATKSILEKIEIENRTLTHITSKERIDQRLWNEVALREAIINAIVHNDYTNENPPKIEIFSDRIEITSTGGLPESLTHDEFFEGFSIPRNKELIRIFKDLGLVEQLGSGIPRILESYKKDCFNFSDNFLRIVFPSFVDVTAQVTAQEKGSPEGSEKSSPKGSPEGSPKTSEQILKLMLNNPQITTVIIAVQLGISKRAVIKHTNKLQENGKLRRVGATNGGYWEVVK